METIDTTGKSIIIGDAPEKEGYTFKGYLDKNTNVIYQPGDVYTVTESITFVAQWEKN